MVTVRLLPPRKRSAAPEWEVIVDGRVAGRTLQKRLVSASRPFYEAYVIHPNGQTYSIELSAEFQERVDAIERFTVAPSEFNRHFPYNAQL